MNASYRFWGIFFALAGTIAFAFRPVLIKMGYNAHPVSATTLLFLSMTLSLPFFLAMAWWMRDGGPISRRDWLGIVGLGFLGGMTRFLEVFESIGRSGEFVAFDLLDVFGSNGHYTARFHETFRVRETGKTVDHDFVVLYRIERDQIVEYVEYADTERIAGAFAK